MDEAFGDSFPRITVRSSDPLNLLIEGHPGRVSSVAFGQVDGREVLASAGYDGTVRLWDPATGQPLGEPLTGHTGGVWSVAFGQVDGREVLASAGPDGTVRLWDPATGQPLGEPLTGHTGGVWSVAFGQVDGREVLASAGPDGTVRLWDPATGQPLGEPLTGHTGGVWSVAFGQVDGREVLASAGHDGTVRLWDPATGQPLGEPLTGHTGGVWSVAFGQVDGREVLASAGHDGTVRLWDPATGQPLGEPLTGHTNWVWSVAFGQVDGREVLASAGHDGTVRLWDPATGQPLGEPLTGHTSGVLSVAFGQVDGREVLASAGDDGVIRVLEVTSAGNIITSEGEEPGSQAGPRPSPTPDRSARVTGDDLAADDQLGRARFAGHLVGVVRQLVGRRGGVDEATGSVVVSVDGRWGSGKSVLVRLVLEHMRATRELPSLMSIASEPSPLRDPVVVWFDAWKESALGPEWWSLSTAINRAVRHERALASRGVMTAVGAWRRLTHSAALVSATLITGALFLVVWVFSVAESADGLTSTLETVAKTLSAVSAVAVFALVLGRALFWTSPTAGRLALKADDNPLQEICSFVGWLRRWSPRPGRHRLWDTALALWCLLLVIQLAVLVLTGETPPGIQGIADRSVGTASAWWLPAVCAVLAAVLVYGGWPPPQTAAQGLHGRETAGQALPPDRARRRLLRLVVTLGAGLATATLSWWALAQPFLTAMMPWSTVALLSLGVLVYAHRSRSALGRPRRPIVLVLDDIDRCHEAQVVRYLETVHTLLRHQTPPRRWPRWREPAHLIVFVLGDGRWIRTAFAKDFETFKDLGDEVRGLGADFIQKLFDHTVLVPDLTPAQTKHFVGFVTDSPPAGAAGTTAAPVRDPRAKTPGANDAESPVEDVRTKNPGRTTSQPDADPSDDERERQEQNRVQRAESATAAAREAEQRASDHMVEAKRTTHLITSFPDLMPGNPRLIRRVVNAWGMLEEIKGHVGHIHDDATVVRAAVFLIRFPTLVDELIDTYRPVTASELESPPPPDDPEHARIARWTRPDVLEVLRRHGTLLEPRSIGECYGRRYPLVAQRSTVDGPEPTST